MNIPVGQDGDSGPPGSQGSRGSPGRPGSDGTKLLRCLFVNLMQYALNVEFYKTVAYILISTIGSI